jgi:hypothetical protein
MVQYKDNSKARSDYKLNDGTYLVANNAAGADSVNAPMYVGQRNGVGYDIYRSYLLFNTNGGPTVVNARLLLFSNNDLSDVDFDVVVLNGMPNHPQDPVVLADYDRSLYAGNGGSISTVGWNAAGYNILNLNAAGKSWINLSGWTKFCLRSSLDISQSPPAANEYVHVGQATQAGQEPILELNYGMGTKQPAFRKPFSQKAFAQKVFG